MRLRLLLFFIFILNGAIVNSQHPIAYLNTNEASFITTAVNKYPLLKQSYQDTKNEVDRWLSLDVDVPLPKDPAGGYTHEKHKANYMLMFNSGILYQLTNDSRYASLVKKILLKYAKLNPTLKKHPEATSSSPGHIFWQALNDANWLLYTGMAYDLVYNGIPANERKLIEEGAFKPEVEFFTKDLKNWFNLIHNHAVWACAAVGVVGIATNNNDYLEMALYGSEKDKKTGFLAQMDGLFSPDGYYTEGPYYVRYAILPFYLFANALNHARPGLKIFEYRNSILKKALLAGLQQTNLNGDFFPLNDAIKDKDYTSNEMVTAVDIGWDVYGKDDGLLHVAKEQNRVLLHKGGASIAAAIAQQPLAKTFYPYRSIEFTDGKNGNEGGVSILRKGQGNEQSAIIFKYTSHGLSHGHFDKLHFSLYDQGNEILTDYGSVRFVGIEQKYGGRYLPENNSYASQTIAHNTIVVDEKSHFDGNEKLAEEHHGEKLFSNIGNYQVQAVGARTDDAYPGTRLQRTLYLIELEKGKKIILDVFNARSQKKHSYDLPFQYNGQVIGTSFKYAANTSALPVFGRANGYQFLWKEAEAKSIGPLSQFTFLNQQTYYSISSLTDDSTTLFFTRTGAQDPQFNLRHEPAWIIRKKGDSVLFLNVIEIHGKYDARSELSTNSYPQVQKINVLQNDNKYTVAEIMIDGKKLLLTQANENFSSQENHSLKGNDWQVQWKGPWNILYEGKILKAIQQQ